MANKSDRSQSELARAAHAYECAKAATEAGLLDGYYSLARKLPMYIQSNGIGVAFAFIKSKRNEPAKNLNEHRKLYDDISSWISDPACPFSVPKREDITGYLVKLPASSYRTYMREVLAYLNWLRKFTEGLKSEADTNIGIS